MFTVLLATIIAAPDPARPAKPTAAGQMVILNSAPPATLTLAEFPAIREDSGRVLIRKKGVDEWVARTEVMTPKEAIAVYTEEITSNPSNGYSRRAKAYELMGNWDGAIKDLDELVKMFPQTSAYWNNRANYYSRKRDYAKALEGYDEAIKLQPTGHIPRSNRGNLFMNLREWDKAMEAYNDSLKISPNYARSYAGRSAAWREKREFDKMLADAEKSVELEANSPHTLMARGAASLALKQPDSALADFNEALRYDPFFATAFYGRAGAFIALKKFQPAIRDLDSAMRLTPKYAAAMARRAEAWVGCGNPRRALLDLNEAIAMDEKYQPAYRQRAWLLATHRDDSIRDGKAAVAAAGDAIMLTRTPGGLEWETLAAAYAEIGDFEKAVEWQRKAIADQRYFKELGDAVRQRLDVYQNGKAYRQ